MREITIFAGHYGSGKTNLAVNYAIFRKSSDGGDVVICDIDTVNPYFRTADSARLLERHGVRLVSPPYANTNVELPSLPPGAGAAFADTGNTVIVDVGGDDAGAVALGQFSGAIAERGYDMWLVVNRYRYLTGTPGEAVEIMREIERASHLRFTGVVNNSNLGRDTTAGAVRESADYARCVARDAGLPLVMTSAERRLCPQLADIEGLFPIDICTKNFHLADGGI